MTEDEGQEWIAERFGSAAVERLQMLATSVREASDRQNLIARSTLDQLWVRHIVDSAQLLTLMPLPDGLWIDVGTGAGFPGLVVAALRPQPVLLVEPRRKRAEFLTEAAQILGLTNVTVAGTKVENVRGLAAVISARAVARVDAVLTAAAQCARRDTVWLLPKGRSAREELAIAAQSWQALFHVEQSVTDPDSQIVTARKVTRR